MSTLALVLAVLAFAVAGILSALTRAWAIVAMNVGLIVVVLSLARVTGFH